MNRNSDSDGKKRRKTKRLSDGDLDLWRYVTRSVSRLHDPEEPLDAEPERKPVRKTQGIIIPEPRKPGQASPSKPQDTAVDRRTADRFRRGRMPIDATIDLHGLSAAQAEDALRGFLLRAHQRDYRCVLVITGKGRKEFGGGDDRKPMPGVLRRSLPGWLGHPTLAGIILSHTPAKGKHGGDGAFYVLLRRRRG